MGSDPKPTLALIERKLMYDEKIQIKIFGTIDKLSTQPESPIDISFNDPIEQENFDILKNNNFFKYSTKPGRRSDLGSRPVPDRLIGLSDTGKVHFYSLKEKHSRLCRERITVGIAVLALLVSIFALIK